LIIDVLSAPVFSAESFNILAEIARTPTAAFYLAHKLDFKQFVEKPLQTVMHREAMLLPGMMRDLLERERNVFSRFLKNDFGHGGAWANYWGAFYPKGGRRIADMQLAVWMDCHRVGISFYIGEYAVVPRQRFLRNCNRYRADLSSLLVELLGDQRLVLAKDGQTTLDEAGRIIAEKPLSWDEWLDDPAAGNYWIFLPVTPSEVCAMCGEELAVLATRYHSAFFPLALLAMEDDPLPLIHLFLG
jgi:5-methylcytosine-specific restriction enzyme B